MDIVKFFKYTHVEKNGCVIFDGGKTRGGYGRVRRGKIRIMAHRFIWEWHNGKIPDGLVVCHKCDNPSCVNIDHLFLGTQKDNSDDKIKKGRWSSGDRGITIEKLDKVRSYLAENPGASGRAVARHLGVSPMTGNAYKKAVTQ